MIILTVLVFIWYREPDTVQELWTWSCPFVNFECWPLDQCRAVCRLYPHNSLC